MYNTPAKDRLHTGFVPLPKFYEMLANHNWYSFWADDIWVFRQGKVSMFIIEKAARDSGPVHQWLLAEFTKFICSGPRYGTPDHPKPPAPVFISQQMVEQIVEDMKRAKAINAGRKLIGRVIPALAPKTDATEAILKKVTYLGAYAGEMRQPAVFAGHTELLNAWAEGKRQVLAAALPKL